MENEEKDGFSAVSEDKEEPVISVTSAAAAESEDAAGNDDATLGQVENINVPAFASEGEIRMEDDLPGLSEQKIQEKKPGKKKKIVIGIIIFLLLSGAAAAAYLYYQKSHTAVAPNIDQGAIVKSSVEAMKKVGTYNYKGTVSFGLNAKTDKTETEEGQSMKFDFNFAHEGVMDGRDPRNPNLYSSVILDGNYDSGVDTEDASSKLNAEFVFLDKTYYLKLNDVSMKTSNQYPPETVRQLEGFWEIIRSNWYYISQEDVRSLGGTTPEGEAVDDTISQEEIDKINNIVSKYDIVKFDKDLGSENIGGVDTYHYGIRLDGREGMDLVIELVKESMEMQGAEESDKGLMDRLTENTENIDKAKEMIDFVLNEVNAEIWIGKADSLVYRIKIDGNMDKEFLKAYGEKYRAVYGEDEETTSGNLSEANLSFSLDYTLSNFDTASVRKPENAKDLMKIIRSIQDQMAQSQAAGTVDSDNDGLTDGQETFYGSDPKKADTDGDGYLDGNEVKNGYDPTVAGSAKLDYGRLLDAS